MKTSAICMLALLATLAGCGGGGGGTEEPKADGDAVPASVMASPEAFTDYLARLRTSDTRQPLALPAEAAPVADNAEPQALQ